MTIQAVNLRSLLSSADAPEGLGASFMGLAGGQADFAAALQDQLSQLQNDSTATLPELAAVQDWIDAAQSGKEAPGMQNVAAFFGQQLQLPNSVSGGDIDLEDTLKALAGVLQQLQQLDAAETTLDLPSADDSLSTDVDPELLEIIPLAEAAVLPIATPNAGLAEASAEMVQAQPLFQNVLKNRAEQNQAHSKPVLSQQNLNLNEEAVDSELNRGFSTLLAAEEEDGQAKANLDFKAESLLGQLNAKPEDNGGKALPNMTGEIGRLNQTLNANTIALPAAQNAMAKPFADPAWGQELGAKLIWMHQQATPSVELRLNPEHLGPVLVKIDVNQDQANVAFTTQHAVVKEAIEAAIPKLREMLSGQQLNLADVNVSQQQSEQRQAPRDFFQTASEQSRRSSADEDHESDVAGNAAQNLVDEIEAGRAVATNGLLSIFA